MVSMGVDVRFSVSTPPQDEGECTAGLKPTWVCIMPYVSAYISAFTYNKMSCVISHGAYLSDCMSNVRMSSKEDKVQCSMENTKLDPASTSSGSQGDAQDKWHAKQA